MSFPQARMGHDLEAWADNPMAGLSDSKIRERDFLKSGRFGDPDSHGKDVSLGEGWLSDADEERLLKVELWWGRSHRMFRLSGGKVDDFKAAKLNDVSAWSIISALIMTIGIGLLTVGTSNDYQDDDKNPQVRTVFVVAALSSSFVSLTSIVFASVDYVYYNAIPAELFPGALLARYSAGGCHHYPWMVASWALLFVATCALVYVQYGIFVFIWATTFAGSIFFMLLVFQARMIDDRQKFMTAALPKNSPSRV